MRRLAVLAAATALVAALVPTTPGSAAVGAAARPTGTLVWGDCPPVAPGFPPHDPRMRCAELRVPMDYRDPRGREITITVSRINTSVPGQRRGVLLSNPGGPGGAGLDLPDYFAQVLPPEVLARYDLIGFDPRGVGESTPITCGLGPEAPIDLILAYPDTNGSISQNVDFARATAQACAEQNGALLPFISTANTARDMDRLRAALGESKISYLGYSYGTYLGAVYASLFPQRGDRIILDSAVDPDRVWHESWKLFGIGTALRFPDFASWAANRDELYGLGATPRAVRATFDRIAGTLDDEPLVLPGLVVNGNVFREITRSNLYDDRLFPSLADTWAFLNAPALAGGAEVTPSLLAAPFDNNIAVLFTIACNDAEWSRDIGRYQREVTVHRALWPMTAGGPANLWPCAFWPTRPIEPPVRVTSHGPRNILILNNLRDPATPYVGALGMRANLGRRAAFVTVDAGGHGVYAIRSGACTDAIASAFLADGVLPAHDRFCVGPSPEEIGLLSVRPSILGPWL